MAGCDTSKTASACVLTCRETATETAVGEGGGEGGDGLVLQPVDAATSTAREVASTARPEAGADVAVRPRFTGAIELAPLSR